MSELQSTTGLCGAKRFQHGEYRDCERPQGHNGKHKNFSHRNTPSAEKKYAIQPGQPARCSDCPRLWDTERIVCDDCPPLNRPPSPEPPKACPDCGGRYNSKDAGGNDLCFHCGTCGYVQCIATCPDPMEGR